MTNRRYDGKIVLVTGGASGIGRATVTGLVREGARVAFTDIVSGPGEALEAELRGMGADVMFVRSDATREADVEALVSSIVARWGRLDVGINNVGNMGQDDKLGVGIHETTLAAWEGTLAVSLTSNFLGMKYELRQMLKQGGGVIANTTSMAGMRVTPYASPAYTAAKAGVIHVSEYAAVLYAKDNIRINVISPGLTATPAVVGAFPTAAERNNIAGDFHPMGRMMTPEELAEAFLWVCSDQASGVTGLTIPVDGGWAAR